MANNGGKGYLFTAKFYKNLNVAAFLAPDKCKLEGKESINPEGVAVNQQANKRRRKSTPTRFT